MVLLGLRTLTDTVAVSQKWLENMTEFLPVWQILLKRMAMYGTYIGFTLFPRLQTCQLTCFCMSYITREGKFTCNKHALQKQSSAVYETEQQD